MTNDINIQNSEKIICSSSRITDSEHQRKTALLIITYNQCPNFDNILKSFSFIDCVFIIDNNSDTETKRKLREFANKESERTVLIFNDRNLGLSAPFNKIIQTFKEKNIYWFYFADQDSIIDEKFFIESRRIWKLLESKRINVGIVTSIIGDSKSLLYSNLGIKQKYSFIKSAITTGIMTNHDIFMQIGGFDPAFFVYGADIEFTLRLRSYGYKICRMNSVLIYQSYGKPIKLKSKKEKLLFRISSLFSYVNVRLNMINAYQSRPSYYSAELLESQFASDKKINIKYKRRLNHLLLLVRKYLLGKGKNY